MFHFQLGPEFKAGAGRLVRPWSPAAGQFSKRILEGTRSVVIGGVAGWGMMVVAGAVLMSNAPREVPPAAATTVESKPAEPTTPKVEAAPVAAAPAPAPSPVAAKSTQRVDMTPTAAIPAEPATKPKHKPHKKKPKDLDNHN